VSRLIRVDNAERLFYIRLSLFRI